MLYLSRAGAAVGLAPPDRARISACVNGDVHHLRPAAFLDRDGVINIDTGYPHRPDQLVFTPTAALGIRRLNTANHLVIVVTNQSGIARGMFGDDDVRRFHAELQRQLVDQGAAIDAFYISPFHPEGVVREYAINHADRKPGAGMILRACADWPIDRAASFLIGDKASDMEAAQRAGIRGVLVPSNTCDLDAVAASCLREAPTHSPLDV